MARRRGKVGECVYCGKTAKMTLDHIPPKNLFTDPKPQLITVPCCESCNNKASLDDEYVRMILYLSEKLENQPRLEILDKIQRSLQKPEKKIFRDQFLSSIKEHDSLSLSGIWLGKRLGYDVDYQRINNVGARIIKGLYFHVNQRRLPDTYDAKALIGDCIDDPLEEFRRAYIDVFLPKMKRNGVHHIDKNVFQYCYASVLEDKFSSAWCLVFYQHFIFYGATLPKEFIANWWPKGSLCR